MMRRLFFATILLCLPLAAVAEQDLLDIYELAVRQDPDLASARAGSGAADARYRQARGQLLPNLSGTANFSKQKSIDKSNNNTPLFGGGGGAATNTNFPDFEDQQALRLSLRQPLFNWSAFQAKDAASARSEGAQSDFQAADQSLIVRTSQRYFDVLAAGERLAGAEEQLKLVNGQLDRANASYESGLAPITDKLEAQSEADRIRVDAIDARNQLKRARVALRQLIGRTPDQLATVAAIEPEPQTVDADRWVEIGLQTSPTVAAADARLKAAQQDIGSARGGHYPTLDFVAAIGETEQSFNFAGSVQTTITETQSFGLELTVPLFAGFTVTAEVDEAQYLAQQARQDLIAAQRQVNLDVRTAHGDFEAAGERIKALDAAIRSGEAAAEAAKAGLQTGTRNILDVLQADIDLVQRKLDLKQAWYDYLIAGLQLKQASGVLKFQDLQWVNTRLQPATKKADSDPAS